MSRYLVHTTVEAVYTVENCINHGQFFAITITEFVSAFCESKFPESFTNIDQLLKFSSSLREKYATSWMYCSFLIKSSPV